MATTVRLIAAFAAILLTHGTAFAQLPVAPQPHLSLDEMVKEYQRWGLPVPAQDVQLVRLKRFRELDDDIGFRLLAFRNPPARPGAAPHPPTGDEFMFDLFAEDAVLHRPAPADLKGVSALYWEWLRLAAQFRLRGWNDAAVLAYANALKDLSDVKPDEDEPPPTVISTLRQGAWSYWAGKLLERASDRNEVAVWLRELAKVEPELLTPRNKWTLECLEKTLIPRKSKPGSVEALIDDLTDHWVDEWTDGAYWKLVELGFDAVPALIEHLDDDRLTRAQFGGFNNFWPYTYRVRHLVSEILNGLANDYFQGFHWNAQGNTIPPSAALKWWGKVRQIGEERWLLDHALPEKDDDRTPTNRIIPRAIRAKYPHRLAALYQTILLKRPALESESLATEIAASTLPRERKVELLAAGTEHREARHRHAALRALTGVDDAALSKHFIQVLRRLPADVAFDEPDERPELQVLELIRETDDRACWDALAELSRRVSPRTRMCLLYTVGWAPALRSKTFVGQGECVRYLLGFLNDTTTADASWDGCPIVRDIATIRLALVLRITRYDDVELRSPREISLLRASVREVAERELARPAK